MPSALAATESSARNLHNSGTDFIQTVTESVMNAKTVPIPASANLESVMLDTDSNAKRVQASKIKINESSITEAETSRKRRRDGDDVEAALVENTKKVRNFLKHKCMHFILLVSAVFSICIYEIFVDQFGGCEERKWHQHQNQYFQVA